LIGDPVADAILLALRQSPAGLSRTNIRDLFGRNYGADKIEPALLKLLSMGKARREAQRGAGRPMEKWWAI
jgi:hypothetical protein